MNSLIIFISGMITSIIMFIILYLIFKQKMCCLGVKICSNDNQVLNKVCQATIPPN